MLIVLWTCMFFGSRYSSSISRTQIRNPTRRGLRGTSAISQLALCSLPPAIDPAILQSARIASINCRALGHHVGAQRLDRPGKIVICRRANSQPTDVIAPLSRTPLHFKWRKYYTHWDRYWSPASPTRLPKPGRYYKESAALRFDHKYCRPSTTAIP